MRQGQHKPERFVGQCFQPVSDLCSWPFGGVMMNLFAAPKVRALLSGDRLEALSYVGKLASQTKSSASFRLRRSALARPPRSSPRDSGVTRPYDGLEQSKPAETDHESLGRKDHGPGFCKRLLLCG